MLFAVDCVLMCCSRFYFTWAPTVANSISAAGLTGQVCDTKRHDLLLPNLQLTDACGTHAPITMQLTATSDSTE